MKEVYLLRESVNEFHPLYGEDYLEVRRVFLTRAAAVKRAKEMLQEYYDGQPKDARREFTEAVTWYEETDTHHPYGPDWHELGGNYEEEYYVSIDKCPIEDAQPDSSAEDIGFGQR